MMTYNIDELRDLVPQYINGTLSGKERQRFEKGVERFPVLQQELSEFSEIKSVYDEMKGDLPQPSDRIFRSVMNRVKADEKIASVSSGRQIFERLRRFFEGVFISPRISWGVVAVQVAIILMLVISLPTDNRYSTLTSDQVQLENRVRISIVFDEESKEKEIRKILTAVEAIIVNGPTPEGLYTLEVGNNIDIDRLLKALGKEKTVTFVEKALGVEKK
jgi:hypothetical protein